MPANRGFSHVVNRLRGGKSPSNLSKIIENAVNLIFNFLPNELLTLLLSFFIVFFFFLRFFLRLKSFDKCLIQWIQQLIAIVLFDGKIITINMQLLILNGQKQP